jgi:transposase
MHLADRGYDADWIRALVSEHGAWANIPPRRSRKDRRTQNLSRPCHQSKRVRSP